MPNSYNIDTADLIDLIKNNTTIKKLNSQNTFKNRNSNIVMFMQQMQYNKTITSLNISTFRVMHDDTDALLRCIENNYTITSLKIGCTAANMKNSITKIIKRNIKIKNGIIKSARTV